MGESESESESEVPYGISISISISMSVTASQHSTRRFITITKTMTRTITITTIIDRFNIGRNACLAGSGTCWIGMRVVVTYDIVLYDIVLYGMFSTQAHLTLAPSTILHRNPLILSLDRAVSKILLIKSSAFRSLSLSLALALALPLLLPLPPPGLLSLVFSPGCFFELEEVLVRGLILAGAVVV